MAVLVNFVQRDYGRLFDQLGQSDPLGGCLRTCDQDFLREGLKNNTLKDLLFPTDPIGNAPQIFGTLGNVK